MKEACAEILAKGFRPLVLVGPDMHECWVWNLKEALWSLKYVGSQGCVRVCVRACARTWVIETCSMRD